MKQQPLLTANEVFELLEKEALPDDETCHKTFKELAEETQLVLGNLNNPNTTIPLLQHCANFLRNRGIYVYFNIEKLGDREHFFEFVAGESGRVYEKLNQQAYYLADLSQFIEMHEHELPPDMIAEKEKIDTYKSRAFEITLWKLESAYKCGDKVALEFWCDEGWKLANEIDAYLDRIKDLQRLFAISLIL
jgi:hypothetical protein